MKYPSDKNFKDFMNPYKNALQNLFLVIDSAHASNNQLYFRYSLFRKKLKINHKN